MSLERIMKSSILVFFIFELGSFSHNDQKTHDDRKISIANLFGLYSFSN